MPDVIHKRSRKFFTRSEKVSGALAAGSIGDIVKPSSDDWRKHYQCHPNKKHEHAWLFGTISAVCSICGKTVPKGEVTP